MLPIMARGNEYIGSPHASARSNFRVGLTDHDDSVASRFFKNAHIVEESGHDGKLNHLFSRGAA
jgi:hypothetical protein